MQASPRRLPFAVRFSLLFLALTTGIALAPGIATQASAEAWVGYGHRWAGALDEHGKLQGIYDLSFPEFLGRIQLGSFGRKPGTSELAEFAVAAPRLAAAAERAALPENWWRSLPWRDPSVPATRNAPERFRLSDLELAAATPLPRQFEQKLRDLSKYERDAEGQPLLGPDFLDQFEFLRQEDGSYAIFWSRESHPDHSPVRLKKLADLVNVRSGLYESLAWEGAKLGVGALIGLIQIPVLSAILSQAVGEFFRFHKLLLSHHQEMLLEMLGQAQLGEAHLSPFSALQPQDRLRAAESLMYGRTSLSGVWRWFFKKPLPEWEKALRKEEDLAVASRAWLAEKGFEVNELSGHFAIAQDSTAADPRLGGKLYLLSRRKPGTKKGPVWAIDYQHPDRIRKDRRALYLTTQSIAFGSRFLPVWGGVIRTLWGWIAVNRVESSMKWEARLIALLEQRQRESHEDWSAELSILERQRLNPLEPERQALEALIRARRDALGLRVDEGAPGLQPILIRHVLAPRAAG